MTSLQLFLLLICGFGIHLTLAKKVEVNYCKQTVRCHPTHNSYDAEEIVCDCDEIAETAHSRNPEKLPYSLTCTGTALTTFQICVMENIEDMDPEVDDDDDEDDDQNDDNADKGEDSSPEYYDIRYVSITKSEITTITTHMMPQDNGDIVEMDLDENGITSIEMNAFEKFKNLRKLGLAKNEITKLPEGTLRGLNDLRVLTLTENKLEAIGKYEFSSLGKLEMLYLGRNEISRIDADAFRSCGYLRILDLSHNKLADLDGSMFAVIHPHLQELNLKGNNLVYVPTNLQLLPSLEKLTLGEDRITELQADTFRGLSELRELVITQGSLQSIQACAFCGLSRLTKLNLADNKIHFIHVDAFREHPPALTSLDLSNNRLAFLEQDLLQWDEVEDSIRIDGNPFRCDCHLKWMAGKQSLMTEGTTMPRCNGPPNLIGKCPVELTEEQFTCGGDKAVSRGRLWIGATISILVAAAATTAYFAYYKPHTCWFAKMPSPKYAYRNLAAAREDEDNLVMKDPEAPDPVSV